MLQKNIFLSALLFSQILYAAERTSPADRKDTSFSSFPPTVTLEKTDASKRNIIEINPLLLAQQGLGFSFEREIAAKTSLGIDIAYYDQRTYDRHNLVATDILCQGALKARYAIFDQNLSGPFVGFKFIYTYFSMRLQEDTNIKDFHNYFLAPTLQVGYRWISQGGFTVSGYVGTGPKLHRQQIHGSDLPANQQESRYWQAALTATNPTANSFLPDFGLTLGMVF